MKIDLNAVQAVNLYKVTGKNTGVVKNTAIQQNDEIEVSHDAKLFTEVFQVAKADLGLRLDVASNLSEIKAQVQGGSYQVADGELASSILLMR